MKKILICCLMYGFGVALCLAQTPKIDTLVVDDELLETPQLVGASTQNRILLLDVRSSMYLVDSVTFIGFKNNATNMLKLIDLYNEKDNIRLNNISYLKLAFEKLLREYTDITSRIHERIGVTNKRLSDVQNNLRSARNEIQAAQTGVVQAKTEVASASTSITAAQKEINKAVDDLKSVKKGNSFWIPTLAGATGLLLGILIGRK